MKLRYTPRALIELDEILSGVAAASPRGADRVRKRIEVLAGHLERFPFSGKPTNLSDVRRLVLLPFPYLLFYIILDEDIVVIGIRHGLRDPATMPDAGDS